MTNSEIKIKALKAIGGTEWKKAGHNRIYFNRAAEKFADIVIDRYNTNFYSKKNFEIYYDIDTDEFVFRADGVEETATLAIEAIKKASDFDNLIVEAASLNATSKAKAEQISFVKNAIEILGRNFAIECFDFTESNEKNMEKILSTGLGLSKITREEIEYQISVTPALEDDDTEDYNWTAYTTEEIQEAKENHEIALDYTGLTSEIHINETDKAGGVIDFEIFLSDENGNMVTGYTEYFGYRN